MKKIVSIIAVGAKDENDTINSISDAGFLTLFNWNGSNWLQMAEKLYGLNYQEKLDRKHGFSLSGDGKSFVLNYSKENSGNGMVN